MVDATTTSDALPPSAARPWLAAYPPGVSADLPSLPFRSLAELIVESSRTFGDAPAFSTCLPNGFNGGLTFAEVDRLSDAFAAYLRHDLGLSTGSRVALQAPNCLSYPVVAFGVFKAGCVLVNTNPLYTAPEILRQFADAQVSAIVVVDLFADRLQAVLPALGSPPVVLVRIDEFFPRYVSVIVRAVQRWWSRALPKVGYPATRLADALAAGAAHRSDTASLWADLGPDDVAALQYTGGTTGVSKGAMLTHRNLLTNCEQMLQMVGVHVRPGAETVLTPLPLYHVFAFTVNLLAFYRRGAHNVLIPNPRPLSNLKRAWENFPITWLSGVNTLFAGLTREQWFLRHPPEQLRAAVSGGMALHHEVAQRWEEVTGTAVVEGYGLTEASPVLTFNPLHPEEHNGRARSAAQPGSVGIPLPGTLLRCVDDDWATVPAGTPGELAARGPQVMTGYWNHPDETALVLRSGELLTGDIATMDANGFFTIVERKKDLILVSGFNVYPNEVEEVLTAHPGVLEAAVIGVPDGHGGERVRAVVVRVTGSGDSAGPSEVTAEQLHAWARERLTAYKVPREVVFTGELPKSPIGKILRKDIRQVEAARAAVP